MTFLIAVCWVLFILTSFSFVVLVEDAFTQTDQEKGLKQSFSKLGIPSPYKYDYFRLFILFLTWVVSGTIIFW